jgi:hypothetical protein
VFTVAPSEIKGYIERASLETGIPYKTLSSIVQCESSYNPNAIHHNSNGSFDSNIWQINSIHIPESKKLGLDIVGSLNDTTTFAIILLKRDGTRPWVCARLVV